MLFTNEEWDVILFLTANILASAPGCFHELDKIYQNDSIKCYRFAEKNLMYNSKYMQSFQLELEIKTHHMLGVIMMAEEDISFKRKIVKQLKIRYPALVEFYENPTSKAVWNAAMYEMRKIASSHRQSEMSGMDAIGCYLISYFYSNSSEEETSKRDFWKKTVNDLKKRFHDVLDIENEGAHILDFHPKFDTTIDLQNIITSWIDVTLFDYIKHVASAVMNARNMETQISSSGLTFYQELGKYIPWEQLRDSVSDSDISRFKYYLSDPENRNMWMYIDRASISIDNICKWVGLQSSFVMSENPLTKAEKNIILSSSKDSCSPFEIDPTKYVYNFFLLRLLNVYKMTKEQYFRDNHERILSTAHQENQELSSLQKKAHDLEKKSKQMSIEMQRLRKENEKLIKVLKRQEKEGEKPYIDEIQRLKEELEQERSLHYDLAALREFVFSLENSEDYSDNGEIQLQEYVSKVNVAILGGHENLRKKLKQLYPDTMILDGTLETINLIEKLQGIDILFLFTDHMNHSTYNNAIKAAQRYQIKLAYVHATNIDMIEAQMGTQIKQYLS